MPIPDLDHRGLLPEGIHDGSFAEIEARFCITPHRRDLWTKAREFLDNSLLPNLGGRDFFLAGSFFSDKPNPGDIDATVVIEVIDGTAIPLIHLHMNHDHIHRDYGVDFYSTYRLPGYPDFTLFFQYAGTKTAAAKGLSPTDRCGIVRIR